jgi:hypothetical protein
MNKKIHATRVFYKAPQAPLATLENIWLLGQRQNNRAPMGNLELGGTKIAIVVTKGNKVRI